MINIVYALDVNSSIDTLLAFVILQHMETLIFIVVLLFSVIAHELAHGYMAEKLGDPTARLAGRLTINPLAHLDMFGSVILPFFLIITHAHFLVGWAKPVPVNPQNFRNKKWGGALVALAGPATNIVIAVVFSLLFHLVSTTSSVAPIFVAIVATNIALAVFNLIPIPPLDGHHILFALLGRHALKVGYFLRKYSLIILIIFIMYGWKLVSPLVISLVNILLS